MKDVLLFPAKFLLILFGWVLLVSGLLLLSWMGNGGDVASSFSDAPARLGMALLAQSAFPACLLALTSSLFLILETREGHGMLLALLVILFGGSLFGSALIPSGWVDAAPGMGASERPLHISRLIRETASGWIAGMGTEGETPRWLYHSRDSGKFEILSAEGIIPVPAPDRTAVEGNAGIFGAARPEKALMQAVQGMMENLASEFRRAGDLMVLLALCASMALQWAGLWFLARLTRWSLFNLSLVISGLVGLGMLDSYLVSNGFLSQLVFVPPTLLPYTPAFAMGAMAVMFWAVSALLPSVRQWKQGSIE